MSDQDFLSAEEKEKIEEADKIRRDAQRSDFYREQIVARAKQSKGFFACKPCGGTKNTIFYQQQTRGGDEPMTNFITCLDCGRKWKN